MSLQFLSFQRGRFSSVWLLSTVTVVGSSRSLYDPDLTLFKGVSTASPRSFVRPSASRRLIGRRPPRHTTSFPDRFSNNQHVERLPLSCSVDGHWMSHLHHRKSSLQVERAMYHLLQTQHGPLENLRAMDMACASVLRLGSADSQTKLAC